MEFVTIHDLSRELNTPARVIRYRLINLIADGKLKEFEDFRRDEFKDDQHFVWKIHPIRFMHESKLKPVTSSSTTDNRIDNQALPPVNQPGNTKGIIGSESPKIVTQPANNTDNNGDDKTGDTSLAREMINLLKEQIKVKDGQLKDQGEQLKETHELNMKLTGTMLQQGQKIENLLRLTGGKTGVPEVITKEGNLVDEPSATTTV